MCYSTKRKIADCVKGLVKHNDIQKITIQDIMDATNMSRQSFYYHFKDIYDVLEWIAMEDFCKAIECEEDDSLDDWILRQLHVIRDEKSFFEKMVREIPWPKILECVKAPVEEQIIQLLNNCDKTYIRKYSDEWRFSVDFFTTSYCYYIMDYLYKKKDVTDEELLSQVHFMMSILEGSPLVRTEQVLARQVLAV